MLSQLKETQSADPLRENGIAGRKLAAGIAHEIQVEPAQFREQFLRHHYRAHRRTTGSLIAGDIDDAIDICQQQKR